MKPVDFLVCLATYCMAGCSTAPRERAATITAKPNFKSSAYSKDYSTFEVNGPEGNRSIFWPDSAPKPDRMDKDRFYTLELIEKEWGPFGNSPDDVYWRPELVRVVDGQKMLYDASICSKHQVQMDRKLVKISYGLPSFTPKWKTLRENAPNDGTVLGGCSVDQQRPETWTWVCPTCQSIYEEAVVRMESEE